MKTIQIDDEHVLSDEETEELAGVKLDHRHYRDDYLFDDPDEDVTILKPDGEPLAVVVRNAIPEEHCHDAYKALREVAVSGGKSDGNRAVATGKDSKRKRVLEDGTVSNTTIVPKEMSPNTGIAGSMDRYSRIPYCRQTAFNINSPDKFDQAVPMFQACDEVFADHVPERHQNQLAKAKQTEDDWLISKTSFTTVTVNLNWQTAAHTDSGDLKEGFGVMTVMRVGDYTGAYYIQPQYQTAFDLHMGDVILSDVHEWHGNGPFHDTSGYYERLSCVMYYRRKMDQCGTAEDETDRAKKITDKRLGMVNPEGDDQADDDGDDYVA